MVQFFFDSVENIVENEENAGSQHFLLFPQCFHKFSSQLSFKVGICAVNGEIWSVVVLKYACKGY